MTADGDDELKFPVTKLSGGFREVRGDVNPDLGHDLDRQRVEPMFFDTRRGAVKRLRLEMTAPAFGHLAAAGVAGAEKENAGFARVHVGFISVIRLSGSCHLFSALHLNFCHKKQEIQAVIFIDE
jgi:hypothetical protein